MPHLFLRNQWYVAARSTEIVDRPLARTICNEELVLFRRADGSLAALDDRCPHRQAPLSLGEVIGGDIQCGYHGVRFSGDGVCTLVPSQTDLPIPRNFGVRCYPPRKRTVSSSSGSARRPRPTAA